MRALLVLAIVLIVAAGASVGWVALHPRPPVILITIDTLRPDRIAAYGHTSNQTPAIDRLAREGMLFERAYCDMPWTTGSMSSVMTGQYSSSHGVDLPNKQLKPEAVTMAEILQGEGYLTGAIVGSFPLDSVYGLDQGFDSYDDEFSLPMIAVTGAPTEHVPSHAPDDPDAEAGFVLHKFKNDAYRSDEAVTDAAIAWLEKRPETLDRGGLRGWLEDRFHIRPFFLWVHYFGPHEKLKGDVGLLDQEPSIIAAYDGDVEKADRAVGRFLERLRAFDLFDRSLLVLHADHGQNLGEFGVVGHGMRLDEVTTRVPLIVRDPALISPGTKRIDVAHNIDILPTVLACAGAKATGLVGRSLLPVAEDPTGAKVPPDVQEAYFETKLTTVVFPPLLVPKYWTVLGPVRRSGMRTLKWRYIEDQVVGECTYGDTPVRDAFGSWSIPQGKPLEASECEQVRSTYLYPVSELGDREPNVAKDYEKVAGELSAKLHAHALLRSPLASDFELSKEQTEKLRSLGYVK